MKTPLVILIEYGYKHYWNKDQDATLWYMILFEIFWLFRSPITTVKLWTVAYKNKKLYKRLGIVNKK